MNCPICGTEITEKMVVQLSHEHGKNFATYLSFIQAVKDNQGAIVVASDYVVMDTATYNKLIGVL